MMTEPYLKQCENDISAVTSNRDLLRWQMSCSRKDEFQQDWKAICFSQNFDSVKQNGIKCFGVLLFLNKIKTSVLIR